MPDPRIESVLRFRLMGYEAQLSREQIRRCYLELTEKFSKRPFAEVTAEAEALPMSESSDVSGILDHIPGCL